MEVRPGYKLTEVGEIPEDWSVKSVHDVAQIKTGPFGTLLKASEYSDSDGVPLISVGEVGAGRFKVTERTPLIPPAVARRLPQYLLRTGDIVFGRKGGVERSALVTATENGWFLGSDGISVRPQGECNAPYLAHQFQRHKVQAWLLQNATGTTMASLNQAILGRVQIPYAPITEQRAIATALSDVDALLESLTRLIAKKRDLKQATMQQLLTGQTRLPGFSGTWEETTFSAVVRHHSGNSTLIKGKLPSSPASGLFPGFSASGQDVWCDHYEHAGEAIIVSAVGSRCGKSFRASGKWCAIANTHVVWPDSSKVDFGYISRYLNDENFWLKSGSGQPFVLVKQTFALPLLLPPLDEQSAIAAVLSDIDAELVALEARLTKTRALKQAMMSELLTGKTRLPT